MVLSPIGQPLANDIGRAIADEMQSLGYALEAAFPGAVQVGAVPEGKMIDVGVALPLKDPAGLAIMDQAVSDPGSSSFRHFITPAEFNARYAPTKASYTKVANYFESYGLTMYPSGNNLAITVSGSPDRMGAAFHTAFSDYRLANGAIYYGPTVAPQVPGSLGITSAYGFTNATFAKPAQLMKEQSSTSPAITDACTGGDTPTQIRTAYGVTTIPGAPTGTGETIAVVDIYDSADPQSQLASDIASFDSSCGVAAPPAEIFAYPVPNALYNYSSQWGDETDLDLQWSHAMAPGATIEEAFSPYTGMGLYQSVDWLVAGDRVNSISLSWGEGDVGLWASSTCTFWCNASSDGSYAIFHPVLQAAIAEGISVFVSSGDCGADDGSSIPSTDYPASDQASTGVGGTVLTLSGNNYGSEVAWAGNHSYSSCSNQGGAGGGYAPTPRPWYQYGYGIATQKPRGVPDVGITAGSPLATCVEGTFGGVYGTSDAAPMWNGLTALADQLHGGDVGFINPALYNILRSTTNYNNSFHDITSGSNGYSAHAGWDPVTGVGTPKANVVIPLIAGLGYLPPMTNLVATLTVSNKNPSTGVAVTFTAAVTGGTGTYPKYCFNFGDGNATTTIGNTATHSFALAGAYMANVEVYDSSGNSTGSAFVLISVGTTPFTLTLAASTTTPAIGAVVTFTATASGGTSPYQYYFHFGDGGYTWQNAVSANTYNHAYGAAGVYCAQANATDAHTPAHDGAISNIVVVTVGGATGACQAGMTSGALTLNRTGPGETSYSVAMNATFTGGTGAITATWCWGDGSKTVGAPVSSSPAFGTHIYASAGTYNPRVFINDSASNSVNMVPSSTFTVYAHLTLSPIAPSSYGPWGPPVNRTFTATASNGLAAYTYAWAFNNGNTSTLAAPPYQIYYKPGTYTVTLTVTDSLSYHASSSYTFTVFGSASMVTLQAGWNLIALPTVANDLTLYEMSMIAGPGFLAEKLLAGTTSTLYDRTTNAGNGNLAFVGGNGLWLDVSALETVTVFGNTTAPGSLAGVSYGAGWSGIGWSVSSATTASALAAKLVGAEAISIWSATAGQWETFIVGWDASGGAWDFNIANGTSVLVFTTGTGTITE
jgi:kumamolisin